jgi:hypothetical protein
MMVVVDWGGGGGGKKKGEGGNYDFDFKNQSESRYDDCDDNNYGKTYLATLPMRLSSSASVASHRG